MKISWNWLNEYIDCSSLSVQQAAEVLTSIGLEVEGIEKFESIRGGLANFFVGEVISCSKHPNADKLSLTQVNLGETLGIKKIVCGAPNVAAGQKVVVATEGAVVYLPNGESFTIKNSKIRGEESQGMICAEDELSLGHNHDGILVLESSAQIGTPAADYFHISNDFIFEIGLTPNRTDAMCHRGVARDLAAAMNARGGQCIFHSDGKTTMPTHCTPIDEKLKINILTEKSPKFGGIVIRDIENLTSPAWLKNRLSAIGESSKNLLVDVTNYILHDLGQPLHAYDLDKLQGNEIVIDELSDEQNFTALNGSELKLKSGDIIIKNSGNTIGIAGVMGSMSSCIDERTKSIFLEGAFFHSTAVRQTSQRLLLRSEAAIKFEKGVDPNGTEYALEKARNIIISASEKLKVGPLVMESKSDFPFWQVSLTRAKLDLYSNTSIEKSKVDFILKALGIEIVSSDNQSWQLSIPRFKEDVKREEDVIEEVLRIYGYNLLPYPKFLKSNLSFSEGLIYAQFEENISGLLTGQGYQEILTNSISQSKYFKDSTPVRLLNSMTSELDCLRSSMIPGFLEVIEYNLNRDQKDLNLYEFGHEYFMDKSGKFRQRKRLILACTGMHTSPNWQQIKGSPNDYYQLKAAVENLFKVLKLELKFKEAEHPHFSFGLNLLIGQRDIGYLGELKWNKKMFDIKQRIFLADLDIEYLYTLKAKEKIEYKEVSKFPTVRRDLALILTSEVRFDQIEVIARKTLGKLLTDIILFDVFKDKSLGEDKKSYAVRFILNSTDKTLSDKEIDEMIQKLIKVYQKELSAEIRS
ncbi:MAG: phenylalanine--tRNA ligase subunit beta [Chitinophagales bacterium]|nr:phenylalanine--tRNA ligase subunit beta [Chitinophagales bacterium]